MEPLQTKPTEWESARGQRYYTWQVEGKAISIRLSWDVIDRITEELLFALSDPEPSDIGGVLLGHSLEGSPSTILVDDYELVRQDELDQDAALGAIADVVARWPQGKAHLHAVGFIRSHRELNIFVREEEKELARKLFPRADNIFLIIRPGANSKHTAGFFFWEDYEIRGKCSYQEFAFQADGANRGRARKDAATTAAAPEGASIFRKLAGSRKAMGWGGVAIAAGLAVLLPFVSRPGRHARSAPATKPAVAAREVPPRNTAGLFDLRAHLDGQLLEIAWRNDSAALARAERGALTIMDGLSTRQISLTKSQLRDGRIYYVSPGPIAAAPGDLGLMLDVYDASGRSVSESTGRLADPILRRALAQTSADVVLMHNTSAGKPAR